MKLQILVVFSLAICFTSFNVYSQKNLDLAKLDSLIAAVDGHNKTMGSLALSHKGKVGYCKTWGYKAISDKEKIKSDDETKYRIGSISKTFTAVMILQLIEEKKLKFTTSLSDFFPELPNAKQITIEQMLSHRSGLYNFTDSAYFSYHTKPRTHDEMVAIFASQSPVFSSGEKAEYSNTNFVLLGYIIEKLTKEPYATAVKKRITDKIGLKNTYYGSHANAAKNEAVSFRFNGEDWIKEEETDMSITGGAGGLVSTSRDLIKFIEALFSNKLLRKESLAKMITIKDGFGLGIFQFPFDEKYAFGHTGGIDEFHSMLGYFPKDSLAFAYTGNGETIEMNDLAIGVLSICFNRPYHIPDYGEEDFIPSEMLAKYEGIYASKQLPLKITVKKDGNRLSAQATGQSSFFLTPISENEFSFDPANIRLIFDRESEGDNMKFVLKQNGGNYVFLKE